MTHFSRTTPTTSSLARATEVQLAEPFQVIAAAVTWNGSANWTSVALASDEVVGVVRLKWVTQKYLKWIDRIFGSRPAAWGAQHSGNVPAPAGRPTVGAESAPMTQEQYDARVLARAKKRGVDPYALIKEEN